jgi:hypothetical protein
MINRVLSNFRQACQSNHTRESSQKTASQELVLTAFGGRGSIIVDVWEDVRAYKGSNFADRSCKAVVLTTVKNN